MTPDRTDILSWARDDFENRFGFPGAKHTRANSIFCFLLAIALTISFFGCLYFFNGSYISTMFTDRGPTPYFITLLSYWSLSIIWVKYSKLNLQRRALSLNIVPEKADFVLSPSTAEEILKKIRESVDDPKNFLVFNRIVIALSNLQNLGRTSDVDDILRSQAEHEESSMETSYSLLRGFIWAIPVLGFIGTVLGLSQAIGGFSNVLADTENIEEITMALQIVTGGLATAFETTLIALVAALVLQLFVTFLKKNEEEFLDECSEYCLSKIVNQLRMLPN